MDPLSPTATIAVIVVAVVVAIIILIVVVRILVWYFFKLFDCILFRFVVYVENVSNVPDGPDKNRMHAKKHDTNNSELKDIKNTMKLEQNVKHIVIKFVQNTI